MALAPGTRLGPYAIVRAIGAGGIGEVYEASDTRLDRMVAIKVLPPDFADDSGRRERFEREAKAISKLNHPNICTLYDVGEHEGQPFLVMEVIRGVTLRERLHGKPLKTKEILELGVQLADALDVAHAAGIIHRDIKPANILVTDRGQAKLLDFGLAKHAEGQHLQSDAAERVDAPTVGQEQLTEPGSAVGTVLYMSPEQARGEELDHRSDLFSFGAVLYEMVTGRQAFEGITTAVVFDAILNRAPVAPVHFNRDVPAKVHEIINNALEKECDLRYQSAADLRADLKRAKWDLDSGRSVVASAVTMPAATDTVSGGASAAGAPSQAPSAGAMRRSVPRHRILSLVVQRAEHGDRVQGRHQRPGADRRQRALPVGRQWAPGQGDAAGGAGVRVVIRRRADRALEWSAMRRTVAILAITATVIACAALRAPTLADFGFSDTLPEATPFDAALGAQLALGWADRPADYEPRTRHFQPDGTPTYINRLFLDASPYLQQHAHNPVNWIPWSDAAFELARALGRPVLLSIGYSTCHWCHVMEDESFDDEEIAAYLNAHYIAIKVDREVRPDLDSIYMSAVQLFTQGGGGWPMTVWLTPDRQPYSGGSYFPARDGDRGVAVGFLTLLERLKAAYDEDPDRVADVSDQVAERIRGLLTPADTVGTVDASPLDAAATFYRQRFDSDYGGLRSQVKFPSSLSVRFLLREHRRTGDDEALGMVTRTLDRIAAGGIHDHVGGGFHRYATDQAWLVPHFEKMLYDNALLVVSYLEAYQVTGRDDFADVARSILRYVARDMTSPAGAFYSATDADSRGPDGTREEGWFFTWTPDEIAAVVGPEQAGAVSAYFGVTDDGNFEGERTVLHVSRSRLDVARDLSISPDELGRLIDDARELLYAARRERPAPLRDEKILTGWNGLMISAFARAALALGEDAYAERAAAAARYLLDHRMSDGQLARDASAGAGQAGYLDDYAFLIGGLLDLYESTGAPDWLREALVLDAVLAARFEDPDRGGFFLSSNDHEALLAREKPHYDSAEPSGNAVQLLNLMRLHEFTTDDRFRQRAERALGAFAGTLVTTPTSAAEMLLALDFHLDTPKEVILVTPSSRADAQPFLDRLATTFLPNRILAVAVEGRDLADQAAVVPLLAGKYAIDGRATAYVCENRVCDLPTTDPEVFARQIRTAGPS